MIHLRYLDLSDCQGVSFQQSVSTIRHLQTLVLRGCFSLTELPQDIGALEQLRYLDVSETNIKELPNSIKNLCRLKTFKFDGCRFLEAIPSEFANLIHLKCLDLSGTRIKELHESVFRCLCNFETLNLGHCKLPDDIGVFKNLRHLMHEGDKFETPRGISLLPLLQTLQQFVVRADNKSTGGGIGDLEGLTRLKGKIKICKLENVRDREDAERANLKGKPYLRCLELHWSSRSNAKYSSIVLNALHPHPDLEILKITNFMGSKLPEWMGDSLSSFLPKLQELVLTECNRWKQLPAFGQLPNLKVLSIHGMNSVKCLGSEVYVGEIGTSRTAPTRPFPSLVELTVDHMGSLESCRTPQSTLPPFPVLEKLTVRFCGKLRELQTPFPTLEEMTLQHCQMLEDLPHLKCLTSLQRLSIKDCQKLKLSPNDLTQVFATALIDIDAPMCPF